MRQGLGYATPAEQLLYQRIPQLKMRSKIGLLYKKENFLGTGPYFVCSRGSEESAIGDKIYMGCKGKYEVISVVRDGLLCKGIGNKSCGIEFLYMGNKEVSSSTGIIKEPHRLIKIKPRKRK